jgi:hypothetical protein
MDGAGKKSVRPSVVIAAVIAVVIAVVIAAAALYDPLALVDLLSFALAVSFFAPVLIPVGIVMDKAGGKSLRASLVIAAIIAAVLYVADAFVFFSEFFHHLLIGVVLLYFLPATLWALRTGHRIASLRAAKASIYLLAAVSISVTNDLQKGMADRRTVKLGDACLAYRAKYHHYPQDLNALVPEFISSVPVARYGLPRGSRFRYSAGWDANGFPERPWLSYEVFEMRQYDIESRRWEDFGRLGTFSLSNPLVCGRLYGRYGYSLPFSGSLRVAGDTANISSAPIARYGVPSDRFVYAGGHSRMSSTCTSDPRGAIQPLRSTNMTSKGAV